MEVVLKEAWPQMENKTVTDNPVLEVNRVQCTASMI